MIRPFDALRIARIAFWGALVFTFACAELPYSKVPQLMPWDKAEHFLAFYILTVLAALAFPRAKFIIIAVFLSGFGGFIELVQALPFVGRDCDVWDWIADTIAIGAVLGPLALPKWRGWLMSDYGSR